jgi:hypothetical protein
MAPSFGRCRAGLGRQGSPRVRPGRARARADTSLQDDLTVAWTRAVTRLFYGNRTTIAGTVYGTIVVLAVLTAGAKAFEDDLWELAAIVVTTVLVLWVAHVYAHGLGESMQLDRRLDAPELGAIARRELAIPLAAVAPAAALVLGAAGVLGGSTAVWLAVGVGVGTLALQGLRYAKVERLGPTGTLLAVAVNLVIGLAIIALKLVVAH